MATLMHPARSAPPTAAKARTGPGEIPTPFLIYLKAQLLAFIQPSNLRAEVHNLRGYDMSKDKHQEA